LSRASRGKPTDPRRELRTRRLIQIRTRRASDAIDRAQLAGGSDLRGWRRCQPYDHLSCDLLIGISARNQRGDLPLSSSQRFAPGPVSAFIDATPDTIRTFPLARRTSLGREGARATSSQLSLRSDQFKYGQRRTAVSGGASVLTRGTDCIAPAKQQPTHHVHLYTSLR
jgi:hypothetical protein